MRESLPFTVVEASPSDPDAQRMLWVYFDELVARYQGRPATEEEIRESLLEAPTTVSHLDRPASARQIGVDGGMCRAPLPTRPRRRGR